MTPPSIFGARNHPWGTLNGPGATLDGLIEYFSFIAANTPEDPRAIVETVIVMDTDSRRRVLSGCGLPSSNSLDSQNS